jgi:hypothetical protein
MLGPGWDCAQSDELHKRSRSHHGRENDFFGACGRHGCKGLCDVYEETFVGVYRSVYYTLKSLYFSSETINFFECIKMQQKNIVGEFFFRHLFTKKSLFLFVLFEYYI